MPNVLDLNETVKGIAVVGKVRIHKASFSFV